MVRRFLPLLLFLACACQAENLGVIQIDDVVMFRNSSFATTGQSTVADASLTWGVFESSAADTVILSGTMDRSHARDRNGAWYDTFTASAANGFEAGKHYWIEINGAVNSVSAETYHNFRVIDPTDFMANVSDLPTNTELADNIERATGDVHTFVNDATDYLDGVLALEAQVETHVTNSLNAYDPPTDTEMDGQFTTLTSSVRQTDTTTEATLAAVNALNDLSEATVQGIVDALETTLLASIRQTDTTTESTLSAVQGLENLTEAEVQAIADALEATLIASVRQTDTTTEATLVVANLLRDATPNWLTATGFSTLTSAQLASATEEGAARVWTVSGRELSTPNNYKADVSSLPTLAQLTALIASATGDVIADLPSAQEIEDEIWNALTSAHTGVGSTGAALSAAGGSGDPWATVLPGAYGAGTAGELIGSSIALKSTIENATEDIMADLDVHDATGERTWTWIRSP